MRFSVSDAVRSQAISRTVLDVDRVFVAPSLSYATTRLTYRRRVCPSHAGNASKLLTVGSCAFHCWVAHRLLFFLRPTFKPQVTKPHVSVRPYGGQPTAWQMTTRYFCRAMLLCISAAYTVVRCLLVCLPVAFVHSVEMNKHIFEIFHRRVARQLQFFRTKPYGNIPTGTSLTRTSNAGGVGKKSQFSTNIWLSD